MMIVIDLAVGRVQEALDFDEEACIEWLKAFWEAMCKGDATRMIAPECDVR